MSFSADIQTILQGYDIVCSISTCKRNQCLAAYGANAKCEAAQWCHVFHARCFTPHHHDHSYSHSRLPPRFVLRQGRPSIYVTLVNALSLRTPRGFFFSSPRLRPSSSQISRPLQCYLSTPNVKRRLSTARRCSCRRQLLRIGCKLAFHQRSF